jgi:uncharacterized protein
MLRRALVVLVLAAWTASINAGGKIVEKGQYDLFLNGINKGYEKYTIQVKPKDGVWSISSEVRFALPMEKAKRGYVDLKVYPVLDLGLEDRGFDGYFYRMSFDDFSKTDLVEAQNSAREYIDQDLNIHDPSLQSVQAQAQDDEMRNKIDLGVNAGQVVAKGKTLNFKMMRFSNSRVKDEPLPDRPTVLDAYAFCLYIPLGERALAMKEESEAINLVLPQGMRLRQATLQFMGIEKTPFHSEMLILRHYDVNVGGGTMSSFWMDKAGKVVQISVPSEGLLATLSKYKPVPFETEAPRMVKQTVAVMGSFTEKTARIPSGDILLGATLTLPAETGTFPTVLMIQDLAPIDRDGNDPANPYSRAGAWKQVAYLMAAEGFATLRVDSRGVGESGGSVSQLSWDQRIQDIVALSSWLAQQPTTKGQKVVFAAQGLGAWAAAAAASKARPSAFLATAYPAKGLLRLWREQVNANPDPDNRAKSQAELETLSDQLATQSAEWGTLAGQKIYLPTYREIAAIDPLALASSLTMPCLFLYPERNTTVMAYHKDVLAPALHAGQETMVLPNLGHKLTAYDVQGYASGLVEAKNLRAAFDWLKKNS